MKNLGFNNASPELASEWLCLSNDIGNEIQEPRQSHRLLRERTFSFLVHVEDVLAKRNSLRRLCIRHAYLHHLGINSPTNPLYVVAGPYKFPGLAVDSEAHRLTFFLEVPQLDGQFCSVVLWGPILKTNLVNTILTSRTGGVNARYLIKGTQSNSH